MGQHQHESFREIFITWPLKWVEAGLCFNSRMWLKPKYFVLTIVSNIFNIRSHSPTQSMSHFLVWVAWPGHWAWDPCSVIGLSQTRLRFFIPFPAPHDPEHLDQEDQEDQPPETENIIHISLCWFIQYFCSCCGQGRWGWMEWNILLWLNRNIVIVLH